MNAGMDRERVVLLVAEGGVCIGRVRREEGGYTAMGRGCGGGREGWDGQRMWRSGRTKLHC